MLNAYHSDCLKEFSVQAAFLCMNLFLNLGALKTVEIDHYSLQESSKINHNSYQKNLSTERQTIKSILVRSFEGVGQFGN